MKKNISVLVIISMLLTNLMFTYADNIDGDIDDLKELTTNVMIDVDAKDISDDEKNISDVLELYSEDTDNHYEDNKISIDEDDIEDNDDNTFGLSGHHFYVIYYDGNSKQKIEIDESCTIHDVNNVIHETARSGQMNVSYYLLPYTGTIDLNQIMSDYDETIAYTTNLAFNLTNAFNIWKDRGPAADVAYGALYPKTWSISYDSNYPNDGIAWSPIDIYISDNFNWATDMTDSSALLSFGNPKFFFTWDGIDADSEEPGIKIKGSKRYMISGTDSSGNRKYKRLVGFATASNLQKNNDYEVDSKVYFLEDTMFPDWNVTARSIKLYAVWEDYIPYTYYVVYKNGTNVEYQKIESYDDPALFANAIAVSGTGYNGWYLMQDGGVVDETNFDATYDPDHEREIASNADLKSNFTNWQNSGEATKNVVFGASYAPLPDPVTPKRGGGGTGGGGGSDLGLSNVPDLLNKHNNIPQTDLNSSDLLKNVLYPYNGNGHHPFYNVTDTYNYKGFGTWQRWPMSDMWFFHCGDPKSNIAANGYVYNGWYYIGLGSNYGWYHFNNIGIMDTGWYKEGNNTYYLNADPNDANFGKMMTGIQLVEGVYRNFGTNGILVGTQ